jgi:hypothetical protein
MGLIENVNTPVKRLLLAAFFLGSITLAGAFLPWQAKKRGYTPSLNFGLNFIAVKPK